MCTAVLVTIWACAGIKGNVVLYTTLMSVCRRGGQPERAMRTFRTMEADGLQLDVVLTHHPSPLHIATCTVSWTVAWQLIMCALNLAVTVHACRLCEVKAFMGCVTGQVAYNQAMASCSWEQAWACFNAMRRAGVQPNTRSYNAVRCISRLLCPAQSSACLSALPFQILLSKSHGIRGSRCYQECCAGAHS